MNHLGLFEGIGGFSLAARWMGWETLAWCEIDPFCQTVLKHHFPNAIGYGDIKSTDFSPWAGKIDILTGGFPCQPYSIAGKRKGTDDERHLWPEMLRAIGEIRPSWIVGENVGGIVNWSRGLVFEQVHTDLEAEGYAVQSFLLPACGVNAPHKRERVWFVAHTDIRDGRTRRGTEIDIHRRQSKEYVEEGESLWNKAVPNGKGGTATNSKNENAGLSIGEAQEVSGFGGIGKNGIGGWKEFPTEWPLRDGNDGVPIRLGGISVSGKEVTFKRMNRETLRVAGNAIVPQVAFQIFKAIQKTML